MRNPLTEAMSSYKHSHSQCLKSAHVDVFRTVGGTQSERTTNSTQSDPTTGIEPTTFLLRGGRTEQCATVSLLCSHEVLPPKKKETDTEKNQRKSCLFVIYVEVMH